MLGTKLPEVRLCSVYQNPTHQFSRFDTTDEWDRQTKMSYSMPACSAWCGKNMVATNYYTSPWNPSH